MKFAIAILSYNHPSITKKCVRSCLNFFSSQEIYLLHHGSLKQHVEQLQVEFPSIHHLPVDFNRGFSGGANFLLDQMFNYYEWVLFLTNDTELIKCTSLPSEPGIYAPLIWRRKVGVMDSIGGGFIPREEKIFHLKSIQQWSEVINVYVPGTAFFIDRQTWKANGPFDESLHTYWEDVDFSMRAQKNNLRISPWTGLEMVHAVGKTCHKKPFYTKELFQRNKKIVSARYLND